MAELRLAFLLAIVFLIAVGAAGRLRFLARELRSTGRRVAALVLLLAVLLLTVFYPVATASEAGQLDPASLWFPALFAGHACIAVFLWAWWQLRGRPAPRDFLFLPANRLLAGLRTGALAGVFGWVFTILTASIIAASASLVSARSAAPSEIPEVMVWLAHQPLWHKLIVIAVAMTVEEAFFRAFLQSRFGLWISSALFALAHLSYGLPFMVVAVFTISVVIGVVFERTHNLMACMAAHGVFDAIQLLVVLPVVVRLSG